MHGRIGAMETAIPRARREVIGSRLSQGQRVVAATLAVEFAVSEDAIRRDLRSLAAEGRCRRVYGGALPVVPDALSMAARIGVDRERKLALACAAATTIGQGELVFLDSGSTNLALAGFLPDDAGLTVATNSVDIAAAVLPRSGVHLIVVGGAVDPVVGGCVDACAVEAVARMNIDRCFVGACSVDVRSGISVHDHADATFKRALLAASRTSLVLAMTAKLGTTARHRVAGVGDIDVVVVEHDADTRELKKLARAAAKLLRAEPPA
jgi:DeoR/GlpR family transcriptional regulator of sugar metabolism